MAKITSPPFKKSANDPKSESNIPMTKQMAKPLMRVDQLNVDASFI